MGEALKWYQDSIKGLKEIKLKEIKEPKLKDKSKDKSKDKEFQKYQNLLYRNQLIELYNKKLKKCKSGDLEKLIEKAEKKIEQSSEMKKASSMILKEIDTFQTKTKKILEKSGKVWAKTSDGNYDTPYDEYLRNFKCAGEECADLKKYLMNLYGLATTKTLKNAIYNKNKETGIIGTLVKVKGYINRDEKKEDFKLCLELAEESFSREKGGEKEFANSWKKIKTIAHPKHKTGYGDEEGLMNLLELADKTTNEMLEKLTSSKGENIDLTNYRKWALESANGLANAYRIIGLTNAFAAEKLSKYSSQENEHGIPFKIVSTILSPITTIAKKGKKSSK